MDCIKSILNIIKDPAMDTYTTLANYTTTVEKAIELMDHLKHLREEMDRKITRAEVPGIRTRRYRAVKWLSDIEKLEGQLNDIKIEYEKNLRCMGHYLPDLKAHYFLSKRAEDMIKMVEEHLENDKLADEELVDTSSPERFLKRSGGWAVGMESVQKELKNYLEDDSTTIIGVYGMAGVGKTLLLENFNNEHLKNTEHHVIWVTIGDNRDHPTIEEIQVIVMERLGIHWQEITNKQQRRRSIYDCISKKPFVLFLDDLWKPLNLHEIGIPTPEPGSKSKIIFSTQIEAVCTRMGATKILVQCLDSMESMNLVIKMVSCCDLRMINQINPLMKICCGLPVAIKTLALAMANKCTQSVVMNTKTLLKIAPEQIEGFESEFLSRMKRTYDNLPSEELQKCFIYCSLLPESMAFARETLINLLLGEGIIGENLFDFGHEAYNSGYNLIEDLKTGFLLQTNSDSDMICMHPMARVAAMWIGNSEGTWFIRADCELNMPPPKGKWESAERISLAYNRMTTLSEIPNCPLLLTLLLRRNRLSKICDGFFSFMTNLRVLDLSNNPIEELPEGIGKLVNLRYLELRSTKIKSLPFEMKDLANLRFLILKLTHYLKVLPKGIIENLTHLQVLEMDFSFGDWKDSPTTEDVASIDEIDRLDNLKTLGITIEREDTLEKLKNSPKMATSTRNLTIRGCPGSTTISLASLLKECRYLRVLYIQNCLDLESVVIKSRRSSSRWSRLTEIDELNLIGLPKAVLTWKNASITTIRKLVLQGCSKMEQLIYVDDDNGEGKDGSEEINIFPHLERLELRDMEELKSLKSGVRLLALPRLAAMKVQNCPKLTNITIITERVKMKCVRNWWRGLEWENEDIKSHFIPLLNMRPNFPLEDESDSDSDWELDPLVQTSVRALRG